MSEFKKSCTNCTYGQLPYSNVSAKFLSVCRKCDGVRSNWKALTGNQIKHLAYIQSQTGSCHDCRYCDTIWCNMVFRAYQKQFCSGYSKRKEVSV
jgi:hypothetical protein